MNFFVRLFERSTLILMVMYYYTALKNEFIAVKRAQKKDRELIPALKNETILLRVSPLFEEIPFHQ